jgi:hypothetical protein
MANWTAPVSSLYSCTMFRVLMLVFMLVALAVAPVWAVDCTMARHATDRALIDKLLKTGLLRADDSHPGRALFVDDRLWARLAYHQKTALIASFSCGVVGPEKELATLRLRSMMTGKTIGEWSYRTLTVH